MAIRQGRQENPFHLRGCYSVKTFTPDAKAAELAWQRCGSMLSAAVYVGITDIRRLIVSAYLQGVEDTVQLSTEKGWLNTEPKGDPE